MDNDIASKLGSLLNDPQALSSLMSVVGPMLSQGSGGDSEARESAESDAPTQFSLPTPAPSRDNRCELLRALKPYLRSERAGRVDKMIGMLQIMSLVKSSSLFTGRRET